MQGFKIAVAGATGNVGREMLNILAERRFPVSEVVALASSQSIGKEVSFGDRTLKCKALEHYDFSDADICLMSAGGAVSKEFSPKIGAKGCVVIDNSSAWRMDPDVPLIVPEVNAEAARGFVNKYIIANPNCSTTQLVVALKPLHDRATIKRVVVATYQSVSGAGKEAMDELFAQTRAVFVSDRVEPKKFLDPKIKLTATCVRVPVFISHAEAVNIEFEKPISADEAREILREAPGCLVVDRREPGGYISRIREDPTVENGLNLWCVSDNLRKGAALNAVQIAEVLANRGWLKPKARVA